MFGPCLDLVWSVGRFIVGGRALHVVLHPESLADLHGFDLALLVVDKEPSGTAPGPFSPKTPVVLLGIDVF